MGKKALTMALVIVFALALTLSLGGCGGKDKGSDDQDSIDIEIGGPDDGGPDDSDSDDNDSDDGGPVDVDEDLGEDGEYQILEVYYSDGSAEWPDTEYTKQIPKPGVGNLVLCHLSTVGFEAGFDTVSIDDARNYGDLLKEAGFTIGLEISDSEDAASPRYRYNADNSSGYHVEMSWIESSAFPMYLTLEKK